MDYVLNKLVLYALCIVFLFTELIHMSSLDNKIISMCLINTGVDRYHAI